MGMREEILNFGQEFAWGPKIANGPIKEFNKFLVAGMGGSNLAAGILRIRKPELDIFTHRDYGLPPISDEILKASLVIASSYSGNTEEEIDAYETAGAKGLSRIAVTAGGKLLALAKRDGVPYIQIPDTRIQPRVALGYSVKAFMKAMGDEGGLAEIAVLADTLDPGAREEEGKALAARLAGRVPVIYASSKNHIIAYNWKIKFNETGKIPAFWNVFPELNHNEMTGFDVAEATRELSKNFYFIFLRDPSDHPKILKRMDVLRKLYGDRGLPVEIIELSGQTIFYTVFRSFVLADWTAYYIALQNGADPDRVPMVEEFKKQIAKSE